MKKSMGFVLCFLICFNTFILTAFALSTEQTNTIQKLLDDAVRVSGTPGISMAVISDGQTQFFNSGYKSAKSKDDTSKVDEHTLYVLGSTSKAYTALGILLLEQKGLFSTSDSIEDYLPWFHLMYNNEKATVTIADILNHTSGLTGKHSDAPRGKGSDMLQKTVEAYNGAELYFKPGTAYAYNNLNYEILGLIIESVTGQSYESFMKEQVFEPLGLHETYLYQLDATATGRMAQGNHEAFFMTFPYDAPSYDGMKPAGFIISSSYDMARWAGIHLGIVDDIPKAFLPAIEKAHTMGISEPSVNKNNIYYSAGWFFNKDLNVLSHEGETPSFKSMIAILQTQKHGIVYLTNARSINPKLAQQVDSILNGELNQTYQMSPSQLIDIIYSCINIFLLLFSIIMLAMGIRNRLKEKPKLTKSKIVTTSFYAVVAIFMFYRLIISPKSFGSGWAYIFDWNPLSSTIILFLIPIFFVTLAWYSFTKNPTIQSKK